MSDQLLIPTPRAALDLLIKPPPYFLVVPCENGEHEILISVVRALYEGVPRWYPAICGRNVWPASAAHPAQSDERCKDCPRRREAMSPQPVDGGPAWPLMHALAPRLSYDDAPRPPRNAGAGGSDEDPFQDH